MGLIFDTTILEVVLGVLLLFWLFYMYMTSQYTYWKDRSIPYEEPKFPFGTENNWLFFKNSIGQLQKSVYEKFKKEKVVGLFLIREPYLLILDPELLKQIMTKDFNHFVDRGMVDSELLNPIIKHLFNMQGDTWKVMRNKLTPAFTSGKMKMMFFLMETCSEEFIKALGPIAERSEKFSIKEYIACFTTDVIASCAFGLESNSIKNPHNEFRGNGNKLVDVPPRSEFIKFIIAKIFPWVIKKLNIKLFTNGTEDFFMKLVGDTIAYREVNSVTRNDFIDILIKIKNNKSLIDSETNDDNFNYQKEITNDEEGMTLEEMTAQAVLFFGAGFETTSSTLSFCLYEISLNSEIQTKLRTEIDQVFTKHNGKASYEALKDMTYMDAVINETLRRYSSLPFLNRQCTEDYKLPGLNFVIPKGMSIMIPVYAIHHDPEYYPDPYRFDPERFTDDKIKTKNNYTFIPFGEGPRMCIGNRFAMMQMKMCLSMLLHKFELAITEDTPIPVRISKKHFMTTPASPIILRISNRT